MKTKGLFILLAAIAMTVASCDKPDPVLPQTPPEPENPEKPQDPEPEQAPFTLKVYDISSASVTVEVEPLDKEAPYYTDVINEADFIQAQKYGFDDYMAWFIENIMEHRAEQRRCGEDGFFIWQ